MRRRWMIFLVGVATVAVGFFLLAGTDRRAAIETPMQTTLDDPDLDIEDEPTDAPSPSFGTHGAPFLARHCVECHSGERPESGIALSFADEATANPAVWEKVARAVRSGRMPPPDRPRPEALEREAFARWAEGRVPRGAGRVALRRLNRAEYNNTVRDLLGMHATPADHFPADDTADGFDTNADVLSISPLLIEKYLSAAEAVVAETAKNPDLWRRLIHPPTEDFVPFVLRGSPPLTSDAVKNHRVELNEADQARAAELDRAYRALQSFADRAFRRPVTHAEMGRLMRFIETALANGDDSDAGFKLAATAVLVSPHFLFRVELDPPAGSAATRSLTDFELATRLSYFLWSSTPDEELFRLAASGKLTDARTLNTQVRRMLRDPKSRALAENFAGQWLQTRALAEVSRDPIRFPHFDPALRRAMRFETEMFFDHIVRTDQSLLDLLTGEYTFVNDRLARHYGLPGVDGAYFRRVSLAGTGRAGVLTHASVLTVTSGPTGTSPVKRGRWILENVLGAPPPPPPPGADSLKEPGTGKPVSLREQLDRHRARAECASCHARMDPLGFGLENFDAVGAWRVRDTGGPVDASGILPDGRSFRGPAELRALLATQPDDFARCLTEKLLTYALGRSLRAADRSTVERIVRHAARNDFRFARLVIALVRSDPFLKRSLASEGSPP